MNTAPLPNANGKFTKKLILLWAILASLVATAFGLLALFLYLHAARPVAGPPPTLEPPKGDSSQPAEEYTAQGFELLFEKRQLASAIATFEDCLRNYPNCAEAYQGLAIAQRDAGDPALAMRNHDRAVELDSERADFYWERGVTCQRLQDHAAAIATFETGLKWINRGGPGFAPGNLHVGLAQSFRAKGDLQKALAHNEQAIALNPNKDWFLRERGYTYQAMGDHQRAQADFNSARNMLNHPR